MRDAIKASFGSQDMKLIKRFAAAFEQAFKATSAPVSADDTATVPSTVAAHNSTLPKVTPVDERLLASADAAIRRHVHSLQEQLQATQALLAAGMAYTVDH